MGEPIRPRDNPLGGAGPAPVGSDPPAWRSLVDVLEWRAARAPDKLAFTFLKDGEAEAGHLTFGELGRRARTAGAALRAMGLSGQRILLPYPQGLDFIVAFFATLHAGATAVPAPAAQAGRATRARLESIVSDARPALALTAPSLLPVARDILEGSGCAVAALDDLDAAPVFAGGPEGAMALLQYTSGSTGNPKGVMVSHANLLHNQELIRQRFEHDENTVVVGWLPMFHDMGLIGNMMQPVHAGCRCVLMSPAAFLQEPARWLRAIATYRGTTSGGPNFAYDLCVDRVTPEQREGLDLSSWDLAFNGSEPVRARTLARFSEAFAPQGFRPEAFYPCYGMAEATLLISGERKDLPPTLREVGGSGPDGAAQRPLVGCGATGLGQELLVVDPATGRPRPEGQVGEIWVSGGSVAQGYWNRPQESEECFGACVEGHEGRFLRTGDLGLLAGGEAFVTGRIKDVLILRGKNYYPQDIEATVQASHPALRPDSGAAFVIEDDERQPLVVVQEVVRSALRDPPVAEIARAVRAAVSREHGLLVASVVLLKTGAIPKTSSGKIQRRLCRSRYLAGELQVVGEDRHSPPFRAEGPDAEPMDRNQIGSDTKEGTR